MYKLLQKHAFITVLIFASIPNPLFDLAGLTCGHFLIPFTTFFTATAIGKAVNKVHIQMIFVIFCFSKANVGATLNFVERISPWIKDKLENVMEKQRSALRDGGNSEGDKGNMVGDIWNYLLGGMVLWFLLSIVNSLASDYNKRTSRKSK